jgi:hypothetical protein
MAHQNHERTQRVADGHQRRGVVSLNCRCVRVRGRAVLTAKRRWSGGAGSALWREFGHRVVAGERIGVHRLQISWQQLVNSVDRTIGDALEYRANKRLRVVAVEFGTIQQAVDRRRPLTAGIAAGK